MTPKDIEVVEALRANAVGFNNLFHAIQRVTSLEQKTLEQLAMKTAEETGELNQAVLSFMKAPGCAYKNKTREDVDEEAVDVILCAAAVLFRNQSRPNFELSELMERKLKAWLDKVVKEIK